MSFIGHTTSLMRNFELSIHVSYLYVKEVKDNWERFKLKIQFGLNVLFFPYITVTIWQIIFKCTQTFWNLDILCQSQYVSVYCARSGRWSDSFPPLTEFVIPTKLWVLMYGNLCLCSGGLGDTVFITWLQMFRTIILEEVFLSAPPQTIH